MLTEPEDVEPDLVRQLDLLDQAADPVCGTHLVPGLGVFPEVAERIDAEIHKAVEASSGSDGLGRT